MPGFRFPPPGPAGLAAASPRGALVLRVALGLVFVAHALVKPLGLTFPVAARFFADHGFPAWSVYPVFAVELVGGLLLLAGIAVRPVAVALAGVMLGALKVHLPNGWYFASPGGGWEYIAVLLAGLAALALTGPAGPRLERQRRREERASDGSGRRFPQ